MISFKRGTFSIIIAKALLLDCSAFSTVSIYHQKHVPSISALRMSTIAPNNIVETSKITEGDIQPGAMIDTTGIAFSGLKGKALSLTDADYPKAKDVKAAIPRDCFKPETLKSLGFLSVSVAATSLCTLVGAKLLNKIGTSLLTLPIWTAYSAITGTVAMGLWVLAHECGHGAFSKNKKLQDAVGYIIHSVMLVPYFSWQRSHAVHHQFTNHMELGETHVPEKLESVDEGSYSLRNAMVKKFGLKSWGALQGFVHLLIGWPAYLMVGATGGTGRGMTNHFYPNPLTKPEQPKRELFPGSWKKKSLHKRCRCRLNTSCCNWMGCFSWFSASNGPLRWSSTCR